MARKGKGEKRTGTSDRRGSQMDRRQFIDIGWSIEGERRINSTDRRQGQSDRREK